MLLFWMFYSLKNPEFFFSSLTIVSIQNNIYSFLQQINILEWFLMDHVTLKNGVMMLKIQLCDHRNKLHFDDDDTFYLYCTFLNQALI